MVDALFVVLLFLYLVVGVKVDQWITMSVLGFKLETPLRFMTHPRVYDIVRIFLFGATAACLPWVGFPWYLGLAALALAWFATTWLGQRLAFNQFRAIFKDFAAEADTAEEQASALENSRKSNAELRDMVLLMSKYTT